MPVHFSKENIVVKDPTCIYIRAKLNLLPDVPTSLLRQVNGNYGWQSVYIFSNRMYQHLHVYVFKTETFSTFISGNYMKSQS